ncbi:MAG: histidine phosphatase family protein [Mobilicoccus sp.]|nr:histidine phosphatase family protein [Mobilicoccus sp.]
MTAASTDLRLLVVMRHGEARMSSDSGDEGRELTDTGRADCEEVGRWLTSEGVRPDLVLVSPATRTRQTWEALQRGGVVCDDVRIERVLYQGDIDEICDAFAQEDARVVLLVGHAPTAPAVGSDIVEQGGQRRAWPPATVAVVSHPGEWDSYPGDDTTVAAHRTPR